MWDFVLLARRNMDKKASFIVYHDLEESLESLSTEQVGKVFLAMFDYEKRGQKYSGDDIGVKVALDFIYRTLDRNREKYDRIREKRREAGLKGNEAKAKMKEANNASAEQVDAKNANANFAKKETAKNAVSVSVPVSDSVSVSGSVRNNRILTDSCAEPETVSTPPAITILTNTGEEYPIYQNDIDRWSEQFPAVNVVQALRSMQAWCDANPSRRKTSRGVKRFVAGWLEREQNKGGSYSRSTTIAKQAEQKQKTFAELVEEAERNGTL
jgi:hypothetical protein